MEFIITEYQQCSLIKIFGRIDSYTSPKIKESLQRLLDEDHHNFVMDLSEVNYISSSGILMFVNLQKKLSKKDRGKIIFSEVPHLIYSNIQLAGFTSLFEFYDDTNTAIRRFQR